jgi:hypothetical protein
MALASFASYFSPPAQVVLVADRQKLPMLLLAALVDPPAVAGVVVALR